MYEKLVKYAAQQLELDIDEITPESTFESLGIDSLDQLFVHRYSSMIGIMNYHWLFYYRFHHLSMPVFSRLPAPLAAAYAVAQAICRLKPPV